MGHYLPAILATVTANQLSHQSLNGQTTHLSHLNPAIGHAGFAPAAGVVHAGVGLRPAPLVGAVGAVPAFHGGVPALRASAPAFHGGAPAFVGGAPSLPTFTNFGR